MQTNDRVGVDVYDRLKISSKQDRTHLNNLASHVYIKTSFNSIENLLSALVKIFSSPVAICIGILNVLKATSTLINHKRKAVAQLKLRNVMFSGNKRKPPSVHITSLCSLRSLRSDLCSVVVQQWRAATCTVSPEYSIRVERNNEDKSVEETAKN